MNDPIPTLRTSRLILRPLALADFPAYRDFMASPRAIGVSGPHDLPAAWAMFCQDRALWSFFGHGALMIDLAEGGECIGQVGINHGPLYPRRNWAGCFTTAMKGRVMRQKPQRRCATGPSTPSSFQPSSATSAHPTANPPPLRSV
ncbi:Acetyltransferase [Agrobacterium tumefaciens]|nr:Acetyltransferase [Agrobacterium tumefaciens]